MGKGDEEEEEDISVSLTSDTSDTLAACCGLTQQEDGVAPACRVGTHGLTVLTPGGLVFGRGG